MSTAEQIAVMQASLEGKRIEARKRGLPEDGEPPSTWEFCPDPSWNWMDAEFRVAEPAPEPRTWELAISRGSGSARVIEPSDSPSKLAWEIVRVVECPPGWKLVPPVAVESIREFVGAVSQLEHRIGNPSAWDNYDEGMSEVIRNLVRMAGEIHAANFGEVGL